MVPGIISDSAFHKNTPLSQLQVHSAFLVPTNQIVPPAFRRMGEGNVFTGVCPSTGDGGTPIYWLLVLSWGWGGGDGSTTWSLAPGPFLDVLQPLPMTGVPLPWMGPGWDIPRQDQDRHSPAPSHPKQDTPLTGYGKGSTHLEVMQEYFLVRSQIIHPLFYMEGEANDLEQAIFAIS